MFLSLHVFNCSQDSPFTNAGLGSNLNLSGEIECDASIMEGKSLQYGAVGAISGELLNVLSNPNVLRSVLILTFSSGIKNPVLVANRLLSEAQKGKLSAGRIPPW